MLKNRLTWLLFLLCVINDAADSVSQIFMKKGLGHTFIHSIDLQSFGLVLFGSATSYLLWVGILIYALNFFLWIFILSKLDLSTAVPIASTNYIILPILATIFLHEHISALRWVGILIIMLGIHFVSKSSRQPQREA